MRRPDKDYQVENCRKIAPQPWLSEDREICQYWQSFVGQFFLQAVGNRNCVVVIQWWGGKELPQGYNRGGKAGEWKLCWRIQILHHGSNLCALVL